MSTQRRNIMRRNKCNALFLRWFFPLLFLVCALLYSPLFSLSWDARNTYAVMIDADYICDWHSDLFLAECILLKHLLASLCPAYAHGFICVQLVSWFSLACTGFIFAAWVDRLERKSSLYLFLIPIIYGALFFSFFYIEMGLDSICIAPVCVAVEAAWQFKHRAACIGRSVACVVLIVALIHVISFRKNSIIAIVPLIYWLLPCVSCLRRRISRGVLSVLMTLLLYCISVVGCSSALRAEKGYPLIPMLASHICTTLSLSHINIQNALWTPREIDRVYYQECGQPEIIPISHFEFTKHIGDEAYAQRRFQAYCTLKQQFVEVSLAHPKEAITAKLLHTLFFYTGNYCPDMISDYIMQQYPHLTRSPREFNSTRYLPKLFFMRLLMLLSSLFVVLVCNFKRKKSDGAAHIYDFLYICSLFAFGYLVSFAIVPPSHDLRYTTIPLLLLAFSLPAFAITFVLQKRGKISLHG